MGGLEDFEKSLAAEKAERRSSDRHGERHDRREKHRHHHRHHGETAESDRHRRHRDHDDDGHRHKRSRRFHDRDDEDHGRSHRRHDRSDRHLKTSDQKEDLPIPDDEKPRSEDPVDESKALRRDDWMSAPSALDIDYVQRKRRATPPGKFESRAAVPKQADSESIADATITEPASTGERVISYTIGDAGSSWRMMKLKGVYAAAKEQGCPVDDVVLDRFGTFEDFDDAREEEEELEKRKLYGKGYQTKEKPTGDFYRARVAKETNNAPASSAPTAEPEQGVIVPDSATDNAAAAIMDQTALNRLRAQMMKAKLRRAPNAVALEKEYNLAAAAFSNKDPDAVVLGVMDNRQLAGTRGEVKAVTNRRGRERGNVEENEDMTIEDMVREERRTKNQTGGEGLRLAERIAKDGKFGDNLEYMDENAEKLAKRVHKNEINLKNVAVSEFQKMNRILDNCPLCYHEDQGKQPLAPVLSLGTRTYITLATEPEISPGGAVIVPLAHRTNLLECDDDEWEEMRNFMKSLTRMYHEQGREVIFYENAAAPGRRLHAAMMAVPIPYEEGATAPAYFREAFLSSDEEWSQHRKVIDTMKASTSGGMGRQAFRKSIAKEAPYFHVWFNLDGGLGHVVEDAGKWPKGDVFAREVIGGIVGAEPHIIKKQGRWTRGDGRVESFKKTWRKFDWTRMLAEG